MLQTHFQEWRIFLVVCQWSQFFPLLLVRLRHPGIISSIKYKDRELAITILIVPDVQEALQDQEFSLIG